jgi:hypothetical protein
MNSKTVWLMVGTLVVVGLGVFAYTNYGPGQESSNGDDSGEEQVTTLETYNSSELGLSFTYPVSYTLTTHKDGNAERSWTTLTLIETHILEEYEQSGAMEGPPAIAVQVFDNIEELGLEEWVTTTSYSNYKLATDPTLLQGEVAGEPAVAYQHSGLYETNAVVVARGGKIYLFSVSWLTQEDKNINDFGDLLESVRFN